MWKKASFLKSTSLFLCLFFAFPLSDGFSATKQRKFRDIYLERRLAHAFDAGEAEKMEKEYRQMEKEMSKFGKEREDWDRNLKKFVDETKKSKDH